MSEDQDAPTQHHESADAAAKAVELRVTDGKRASNLADIAKATGVSISTVSRALSGAPGVNEATSRRIRDVAETLSYRARGITAGPFQINVVTDMTSFAHVNGSFYGAMAEGIESEVESLGGRLSIAVLDKSRSIDQQIEALHSKDVPTGYLLISIDDDALKMAVAAHGPVVLVNGIDPMMRYDGISLANIRGAYLATRHLLELGHRRIAHFTFSSRSTMRDRQKGYRTALAEYDVPFDPALMFELDELSPEAGARAARRALEGGTFDATAIFAATDLVSVGVISSLRNAGLSVPDDVSIIGFDNIRVAAHHHPGITTVQVDAREVGRLSVRRMVELLKNPGLNPVDTIVSCKLVIRESTRPLIFE